MGKNKSSVSKSSSYQEIGEYWNNHDLGDIWEKTEPVDFEVDIQSERRYFAIDIDLAKILTETARKHGISPETLVNLWLKEKISQKSE